MKTLEGVTVPDEMYTEYLYHKEVNRRMFLSIIEDDDPAGCSNCNGGGTVMLTWVKAGPYTEIPGGGNVINVDEQWFKTESKSYRCPVCMPENAHAVRAALAEDSGLYDDDFSYRLHFLDNLEGKEIALAEGNKILAQAPIVRGFYTFFGDYGVGKSGILKSIVASCLLMGVKAKYVRANDLLTLVRHTYGSDTKTTEETVMRGFSSYQVLAIDEIDRVSLTDWARATLFAILDDRYNMRKRRATLLATNQFPDSLGGDWEYLMSRMEDGKRIPVGGESLRGKIVGEQDSLVL